MQQVLGVLLALSVLLALVLTSLTVIRKLRRDRAEVRYAARRARFRDLLTEGTVDDLSAGLRSVCRRESSATDLLIALQAVESRLDRVRRTVVHDAVTTSGLRARLLAWLGSRRPVRRGLAALLIGELRISGSATDVARLLADRDGDVRLAAVRALARQGDDEAARLLIAALDVRDLEPERVIERLGAPWAVPALLDALLARLARPGETAPADPDTGQSVRASIARALGLAGDTRAEDALVALLRTGSVEERIVAARSLGTAATPRAAPALEAALGDDRWAVRAQVARSLGTLRVQRALPALTRLLEDPAWWVRAAAADALVDLGEPGIAVLRAALEGDDPYARDRAREALAMHRLEVEHR